MNCALKFGTRFFVFIFFDYFKTAIFLVAT